MEEPADILDSKHAEERGDASSKTTSGKGSDPTNVREPRSALPAGSRSSLLALSAQAFPVLRDLFLGYGMLSHLGAEAPPFLNWLGCFLAIHAVVSKLASPIIFVVDYCLISTITIESGSEPYAMFMSWVFTNRSIFASRKVSFQTEYFVPSWRVDTKGQVDMVGLPFVQDTNDDDDERPIEMIFNEALRAWSKDAIDVTEVFRPSDPDQYYTELWQSVARRPKRSMKTVILDKQVKARVLDDMNRYLLPRTAKWYADRGIPLRRGYGFYGPPGTGKTSFASACAATFGIPIYVLSLHDASLTEARFNSLVNALPFRSILLLEDIDAAGLRRDGDDTTSGEKDGKKIQPLSLSGLLNAIDGVSSQEGRILIMTANKPELLDEALVRPGRVDVQVYFENASSSQAAEQFRIMYEEGASRHPPEKGNESDAAKDKEKSTPRPDVPEMTREKLDVLSQQFAAQIPDAVFSHAEIQNFLLGHRDDPVAAAEKAGCWAEDLKKLKESKRNEAMSGKDVTSADADQHKDA
ncbi:hypothetical protein E4U53_001023 [Claviceps sorghi]|nr:hypothetical protein E4U53_001023 [Claviceps sorghi]